MSQRDRPLVMVVEDDEEMNELERQFLELYGLDTVPAYSGREALEVARRCPTDAILLDIMLPEMDGYETCRRLRRIGNASMPVVMISALDSPEGRVRGFSAGADAYFTKPFNPQEVVGALQRLLGSGNHREAAKR